MKKVSKLKIARVKAGLTQRDLAKHLGVSQAMVSRWESSRIAPAWRVRVQQALWQSNL